ncbi:TetR/AcrR family transcriptional regulator [Specibacter sp. NPDC057265]|uniref:TetR/AcrR family transcriptional regulator n=1 Tax=Specibacter sp. NPDC057265 TaxID=3346075 RepID=UPI00362D6E83
MNILHVPATLPAAPGPAADEGLPVVPMTAAATLDGSSVRDGRSVRWEAHREQRRRELIKTARRAIHRLGPDASMEDIATAAGTSKSVFYRYFKDKSGLRQAVGTVVIRQMQERITAARLGAAEPREGVTAMVAAYLEMAHTSPRVYFFATIPSDGDTRQSGELRGFFDSVTAMLTEPLQRLLGDADPALLQYWPTAAIGLVRAAGEAWLQSPDAPGKADAQTMAAQIAAWLFDGVGQLVPATAPAIFAPVEKGQS